MNLSKSDRKGLLRVTVVDRQFSRKGKVGLEDSEAGDKEAILSGTRDAAFSVMGSSRIGMSSRKKKKKCSRKSGIDIRKGKVDGVLEGETEETGMNNQQNRLTIIEKGDRYV